MELIWKIVFFYDLSISSFSHIQDCLPQDYHSVIHHREEESSDLLAMVVLGIYCGQSVCREYL